MSYNGNTAVGNGSRRQDNRGFSRGRQDNRADMVSTLVDIRRDLQGLLARVDEALGGSPSGDRSHGPRVTGPTEAPVEQTWIPSFDHRADPSGLVAAVARLQQHVDDVNSDDTLSDSELRSECQIAAAKARLFQIQATPGSDVHESTGRLIRAITKIVSERRPGHVFGLSTAHNADWGKMIDEYLENYTPVVYESA